MARRRAVPAAFAALAGLTLAGCVVVGDPPSETIPAALLASDLEILEASADTSTSGLSVSVWVRILVERDELSADELRDVIALAVDNTEMTNPYSLAVSAESDEVDPESVIGSHVAIDLEPAAAKLGLELYETARTGDGTVAARWEDVIAMLEATR